MKSSVLPHSIRATFAGLFLKRCKKVPKCRVCGEKRAMYKQAFFPTLEADSVHLKCLKKKKRSGENGLQGICEIHSRENQHNKTHNEPSSQGDAMSFYEILGKIKRARISKDLLGNNRLDIVIDNGTENIISIAPINQETKKILIDALCKK